MKVCQLCGKEYPDTDEEFCECGGPLVYVYVGKNGDIEKIDESESIEDVKNSNAKMLHTDSSEPIIIDISAIFGEDEDGIGLQGETVAGPYFEDTPFTDEGTAQNQSSTSVENSDFSDGLTIQVYKDGKMMDKRLFMYDEINIGRQQIGLDIDLEQIDSEKHISRNHVKLVRENNEYYLIRTSKKTPTYLNGKAVNPDEKVKLLHGDKIVLSEHIGIKIS